MQKLIEFALCGSYSKEYNPYAATGNVVAQKILLAINRKPLSLRQIVAETNLAEQEVLQHLGGLERCQLVKKTTLGSEPYYQPSFAIFSLQDQKKLQPLIEKLSRSLTDIVKDFVPTLTEELEKIKCVKAGYHFPDLEYIIIGAYTLDYGGLEILREEGLLAVFKEMPGGSYVFAGLEAGLVDLRGAWMWGHNGKYGKYTFSTHGKLPPRGDRRAFPDLGFVWTYYTENEDERKRVKQKIIDYGDLLYEFLNGPLNLDDLSKTLGRSKVELIQDLTLLEELEYVVSTIEQGERRYELNRPVLLPQDEKRTQRISREVITQFANHSLKASYKELENVYEETAPAKNGVPMQEAFNQIYHNIFEKALSNLVASEVIATPPLRRDGGRYSAWVAVSS
ncbi:MAG: winged helix-turn-helix domain-containing protein [Candidatus Bathyarchaeia archaeon]